MTKSLLTAFALLTCTVAFAQHRLEKQWESDSTTLKGPESVLFDPTSNTLYVSSMGSGSVVRMDVSGKVIQRDWVVGLNANKGSALHKGLFYTAEPAAVAVIDVAKAVVVRRIPVEGAVMLNDVAIDANGIVYVSDTRAGRVYRIENDKPTLCLDNVSGANGLLTIGSDVYVAGATTFLKVDAKKQVTKIADEFESGLDGIVRVANNEFIVSNYRGMLYYVKADGTKQVLLDTRTQRVMANDIGYNPKTRTLFVPAYGTNRIIAYTLR